MIPLLLPTAAEMMTIDPRSLLGGRRAQAERTWVGEMTSASNYAFTLAVVSASQKVDMVHMKDKFSVIPATSGRRYPAALGIAALLSVTAVIVAIILLFVDLHVGAIFGAIGCVGLAIIGYAAERFEASPTSHQG